MKHYLFVHFRESTSPEGEQVHFAVSRDGFVWEALNGGRPILWAYAGDHGVRDMTIVRDRRTGRIHIFATDLSLAYGMRGKYAHSWDNIRRHGSKALAHWQSDDLVHWTEEELIEMGGEAFGCLWAPDVLYDPEHEDYMLHWSSTHADDDYRTMAIYYSRTKDFAHFTAPKLLYRRGDGTCIDSAMYRENGRYYLFIKCESDPQGIALVAGDHAAGPFEPVEHFDEAIQSVQNGLYEAPTAVQLDDGRWCLFLDYYGVKGAGQGYVPFVASSLAGADFARCDEAFSFPYGFKHGTILPITPEEYERMKAHDWSDVPDNR